MKENFFSFKNVYVIGGASWTRNASDSDININSVEKLKKNPQINLTGNFELTIFPFRIKTRRVLSNFIRKKFLFNLEVTILLQSPLDIFNAILLLINYQGAK